jgi:hypothetical protein
VKRLFLDCDGVLADFDGGFREQFGATPREYQARHGASAFWRDLQRQAPQFYLFLPLMADARELFDAVAHLEPAILTGVPLGDWAEPQKIAWAGVHFPGTPVITCLASEKSRYCRPGDVLVDDRDRYRRDWEDAGGVFVHHRSAAESIPRVLRAFPESR